MKTKAELIEQDRYTLQELNEVLDELETSSLSLYGASELFGTEELDSATIERLKHLLDSLDSTKESLKKILNQS